MSIFRRDILLGKAALVTGSNRGLGKEIAVALAEHGAQVAFHGRVALGADLRAAAGGWVMV